MSYKDRAKDIPNDGPFPELATLTRRLLGWEGDDRPFMTTRAAARKTDLSNSTISLMARGDKVSPTVILRFAKRMGGDATQLLLATGVDPCDYIASLPVDHILTAEDGDRTMQISYRCNGDMVSFHIVLSAGDEEREVSLTQAQFIEAIEGIVDKHGL